jgi:lysozyme family protein
MTFDEVFDRVIGHESGYVNDPNDPGGETKWGISKRSYPRLIIKELTRDDARKIWKEDFWSKLNADNLPDGVQFQLFDFALHSGTDTAIRYLQKVVGVADDGYWGPVSEHAALSMVETDMIVLLNSYRLDFMTRLKNWPSHGKGWARRIAQNLRYAAKDS